ncbi:MAG: ribulose-phosphate 3-epimerase [Bacilli bacterium]|nr:ribulose-phosphate 3-epimerase [Bacilli bacterium]
MKTSISITKVKTTREECVKDLLKTNVDYIHIDMMDGKFVNNTQLLPKEVLSLVDGVDKPLDIHMMVVDPIKYIRELQFMTNINNITVHEEIGNTDYYIDCIHSLGFKAGLAINPDTKVDRILQFLDNVDIVLIMGVFPGLGGQEMIMDTTNKIKELIELRNKYDLKFEIVFDGGVNEETIKYLEGLDIVVSGSYVCLGDNMQQRIDTLR